MPRKNPHRPFIPNPEQMALAPEVSGNAINGLGEDEHRRPSVVYWATNPDDIPHGRMQKWFYTVDPGLPEFGEERAKRMEMSQAPLPPVSQAPAQRSPEDWTRQLDQFIANGLCEKVGVAAMNPSSWRVQSSGLRWVGVGATGGKGACEISIRLARSSPNSGEPGSTV